ncbi:Protein of unknown function [Pyronema omphalodes CBS 100304]|uniref:Uncharacterized protein n=1 Tax=Pyronema omphalodes (strain CBS 100304) TaxID=1076935 RepID=U4L7Q9_PYROM|nr:Protein of unknown function [Pyronema omphalodes CBS 100304]
MGLSGYCHDIARYGSCSDHDTTVPESHIAVIQQDIVMTELIMAPIPISTHEAILSSHHGTTGRHIKGEYELTILLMVQQLCSYWFFDPKLQRHCTKEKDQALGEGGRT